MSGNRVAIRIEVRGVVQGVGFRPSVYRIAEANEISGWVHNDSRGLLIHAEGEVKKLDAFVALLRCYPPPGAEISSFECQNVPTEGSQTFEIRSSQGHESPTVMISPDLPICDVCISEMKTPGHRRFLYPYINCTACGPRYSIVKAIPYDRIHTTMAAWSLCEACVAEYNDPRDRRYHAQATACSQCGPNYRLVQGAETLGFGVQAIQQAAIWLNQGMIIAIKGIGGFHLACSAHDSASILKLRERKYRKEKPFALMTRDLESAKNMAWVNDLQASLLEDKARPIVLTPARVQFSGVAENTDELGIMLPYTPLHELLFHLGAPDPLVMTSGNHSSEPIAFLDDDALERLAGIADAFLIGERPIARRVEDSVVAVRNGRKTTVRRARGLAPASMARLSCNRPILAVGADLKNTLTLVVSGEAISGQHIGDLGYLETDRAFEESIQDLLSIYQIDERDLLVAHDGHPEYMSTRMALLLKCKQRIKVQHHRAHVASVMAETGELDRPVVGIVLDGAGYGDDASIWGFEIFTGSVLQGFQRVGHMAPAQLPGGDAAARLPVQAAAGFLAGLDLPDLRLPPFCFTDRFFQAQMLVAKRVRCFTTTSAGRLFDTVAALCGFTREISYEGQAAIWLEHQALGVGPCSPYPFPQLDYRPLLQSVIADRLAGRSVGEISNAFHAALAQGLADIACKVARPFSISHVALSGGVFQNRLLRSLLNEQEGEFHKLTLRFNESVPANDGGISLGQAAIASVLAGDR